MLLRVCLIKLVVDSEISSAFAKSKAMAAEVRRCTYAVESRWTYVYEEWKWEG
jgi:hypothetical protein